MIPASSIPPLDQLCGRYFRFRDLIACGETQRDRAIANLPTEAATFNALFDLAVHVLDPIVNYLGMVRLTFGFCSSELAKHIPGRIAPALDQHASHERNRLGNLICSRLGAAVDLIVDDENMIEVAQWIATNLPFDRLYVYAKDRPVHVSFGPQHSREVVYVERRGGRTVPRVVRDLTSLSHL